MSHDFDFDTLFDDFRENLTNQSNGLSNEKNSNLDVLSKLKVNLTKKSIFLYILQLLSRRKALYGYEIQSAIQEEFDIEMDEEAALGVKTVGKAIEFITEIVESGD